MSPAMQRRKRIRFDGNGVSVAVDINAAIAVNRADPGATNESTSVSHVRVAQGAGSPGPDLTDADVPETEQEDSDE